MIQNSDFHVNRYFGRERKTVNIEPGMVYNYKIYSRYGKMSSLS